MGHVRVTGLDFEESYLRREIATFRRFVADEDWMTQKNLKTRRAVITGLTFVLLNLRCGSPSTEAWADYHQSMDIYYDKCAELDITM